MTEHAKAAEASYKAAEYSPIKDVFKDDFLYSSQSRFKIVPPNVATSLRDMLISDGAPIQKRNGLKISKALSLYTEVLRKEANVANPVVQDTTNGNVCAEMERAKKVLSLNQEMFPSFSTAQTATPVIQDRTFVED